MYWAVCSIYRYIHLCTKPTYLIAFTRFFFTLGCRLRCTLHGGCMLAWSNNKTLSWNKKLLSCHWVCTHMVYIKIRINVFYHRFITREKSFWECYPKSVWNRCALPESRVVKVNADLLAIEPLPIYIGITMSFKLGLHEEAGVWQKNARRLESTSVPLFVHCRKAVLDSRRQTTVATGKRWFGFRRFKKSWRARATRAKARRLDQNSQSLAYKAQRSDHWATTAYLR